MNHYTVIVCTELSGVWPVVGTQEGLGMLCTIISVLFKKKKKKNSGIVLMSSLLEYLTTFLSKVLERENLHFSEGGKNMKN